MADAKIINTRLQTRHDTKANWTSEDPVLLAGEIGIETDTLKQKIGDGTSKWSELAYVEEHAYDTFTQVVPQSATETDAAAIARVITTAKKGDMCAVKREITTGKYSYTAYVYSGSAWGAMDGNYRADNVYLSEDITLAGDYTQVGNLTKTKTGTATFAVAGKTVSEALTEIFSKRLQPDDPTQPSLSIKNGTSALPTGADNEIGTAVSVSGNLVGTLSPGSYTYGPPTGVTAKTWEAKVKYTQGKSGDIATGDSSSTAYSYSFTMGTDGETIKVNFYAKASYDQGAIAKDNLGSNSDPIKRIAAGSKDASSTATYTCYRKMFYGTRTDKANLDSAKIRALSGEKAAKKSGNSLNVSIPVGAMRVIIALPAGYSMTSVKDVNDSSAEILSAFASPITVAVEGAAGYTAADYNVYICDYANATTVANTYKVTIA